MSVITYGFLLGSGSLAWVISVFSTGGLFCFSGINYTTESISGNGSTGISKGHHATPIGKRYISAPCIGNEYIMLSERSWCGVSTPLRSGKDSPTNGINNFFSGIRASLGHNLGYNSMRNADIQGFCSWIAWGRDGFLHGIIVQFPGAKWQSLSSFLGLKWLLYGSPGRLFHFLALVPGLGMQSL